MQHTTNQQCHRPAFISGTISLKTVGRVWNWWTHLVYPQSINTSATVILDEPHLTVRQLAWLLYIIIRLFFWPNSVFLICMLDGFCVYSHHNKKPIRIEVCQYLIEQVANDTNYLNNIVTANEMWIYCYNPEFKQQTSEWVLWGSHLLKSRATKLKSYSSTQYTGLCYNLSSSLTSVLLLTWVWPLTPLRIFWFFFL